MDDIRRLFEAATVEKIKVQLPLKYNGYTGALIITNDAIKLGTYLISTDETFFLEKKVRRQRIKRKPSIDMAIPIIRNYEKIRKDIELQIESVTLNTKAEKDLTKQAIANIRRNYTKDAIIELDLGFSQNRHEIEVVEDDGKRIGIINFGNRLIKIITDGDIVLIKKDRGKHKQK